MVKQIKKRGVGRPATGRSPSMRITLPASTMLTLKRAARHCDMSCSSVIKELIESATKKGVTR